MKKSELREIIKEMIKETNINEESDYTLQRISGNDRKKTMVLKLGPNSWKKVSHLFDKRGNPIDKSIKSMSGPGIGVGDLHAQKSNYANGEVLYKIYGVSGDHTFGNAPTFYNKKYAGNIKVAKIIFNKFINKYLK